MKAKYIIVLFTISFYILLSILAIYSQRETIKELKKGYHCDSLHFGVLRATIDSLRPIVYYLDSNKLEHIQLTWDQIDTINKLNQLNLNKLNQSILKK